MSWESTAEYYKLINEAVGRRLGNLHSGKIILNSVDFGEIEHLQHNGEWQRLGIILSDAAYALQKAGAEGMILCTNTMHKLTPHIKENIDIPFIHIADETAKKLIKDNIQKVGLLGTAFTMEQEFYKSRLIEKYSLEVLIPPKQQIDEIHRVIYDELCVGITKEESRAYYAKAIEGLQKQGAQAVILGCTEIGLLISQEDSVLPIYDTTKIHAEAAVEWMLQ